MEDDLEFDIDRLACTLPLICSFLQEFGEGSDEWDQLLLGHAPYGALGKTGTIMSTDGSSIYKTASTLTHCYIANLQSPVVLRILAEPVPTKRQLVGALNYHHVDHRFMGEFHNQFAIYPMPAFQRSSAGTDNALGWALEWSRPSRQLILDTEERVIRHDSRTFGNPSLLMLSNVVQCALYSNAISRPLTRAISKFMGKS
jgi:hypothetical protein